MDHVNEYRRPEYNTNMVIETLAREIRDIGEVFQEQFLLTVTMREVLGNIYLGAGRVDDAEAVYRELAKWFEESKDHGVLHPDTLLCQRSLTEVLRQNHKLQDAEELIQQVLGRSQKPDGKIDQHIIECKASLGCITFDADRVEESTILFLEVQQDALHLLGPEHPQTLFAMTNLASAYRRQNMLSQAEELDLTVLDIKKWTLDDQDRPHYSTVTSAANLAFTYFLQKRWDEAEKMILSMILRGMGYWSEVEEIERQLVKTASERLGKEHPYTLTCLSDFASSYMSQGCWKKAEELLTRVLEMQMRVLGPENSATLVSMANLGMALSNQGRLKEGDELLSQVIEIQTRIFGNDHPATLLSIENLVPKMSNQEVLLERQGGSGVTVLETRKMLGVMHETTPESMLGLAATYISRKQWEEAGTTLVRTIDMQKAELWDTHFYTLASIKILGFLRCIQGRHGEGEALVVHVMETLDRELGPEFPYTRDTMALLALRYRNQGRWEELQRLELRFAGSTGMAEIPADAVLATEILNSLSNLASAYEHKGLCKEAEKKRLRIIEVTEELLGNQHSHMLINMEILSLTYGLQNRWQEGKTFLTRILGLGTEHEETGRSIEYLSLLKQQQNQFESNQGIVWRAMKEENHNDSSLSVQRDHSSSHSNDPGAEGDEFTICAWKELDSLEKGLRESRPTILENRELAMRPAQIELFRKSREEMALSPAADDKGEYVVAAEPESVLSPEVEELDPRIVETCESSEALALDFGNSEEVKEEAIRCESPEPLYLASKNNSEVESEAGKSKGADCGDDEGGSSSRTVLSDVHIMPWEDLI
jgi:tetratricopeptide (TPR) repeat protein